MIRKFRITNHIKGELQFRCRISVESMGLSFEKINQHNQVAIINTEKNSVSQLKMIYQIIGINGIYARLHAHREITLHDLDGYVTGSKENVTNESEKAIMYMGCWLPKSQCRFDGNIVYIKSWLFEKNISFFQM